MNARRESAIQEKIVRVKSLKELARAVRSKYEVAVYEAPHIPAHIDFDKLFTIIAPESIFGDSRLFPQAFYTSEIEELKTYFKEKKARLLSTSGRLSPSEKKLVAQCLDFIAADTLRLLSHFPDHRVYFQANDMRVETEHSRDRGIQNFHDDAGRMGHDCIRLVRMYRGPSTIYKSTGPWTTVYSGRDGSISAHRTSPTTVQHRAPLARKDETRYAAVFYIEKPRT